MHLLERYSSSTRLRIASPDLYETYFPLPFKDYVVVVNSSGMTGKNYKYFRDVLFVIKDKLDESGIKIVQLGLPQDQKLQFCVDLRGKTRINQFNHLIKNSKLVISGDTSALHVAGAYNVPFVSLFGLTDPNVSGAYFGDKSKQVYLTPQVEGYRPSFDPSDPIVNQIPIEKVAEAALNSLNLSPTSRITSLYTGDDYGQLIIESIPNQVVNPEIITGTLNIRLDYLWNDDLAYQQTSVSKTCLITNKALNINILRQLKANVKAIIYILDENHDKKWVKELRRTGISFGLMSRFKGGDLNELKLLYCDYGVIVPFPAAKKEDLNNHEKITYDTIVRSSKIILSNDKIFATKQHWEQNKPSPTFIFNDVPIIDSPEFFEESNYYYLYNKESVK